MFNVKEEFLSMLIFILAFSFHEFEEMLYFPKWLAENKIYIINKFPIAKKLIEIDSQNFQVIVYEEFTLLILTLIITVKFNMYILFLGVMVAYSLHVVVHIIQMFVLRKKIPGIWSGVASLMIVIPNVFSLWNLHGYSLSSVVFFSFLCTAIAFLNLLFCHVLIRRR